MYFSQNNNYYECEFCKWCYSKARKVKHRYNGKKSTQYREIIIQRDPECNHYWIKEKHNNEPYKSNGTKQ